jgi:hypothetical protein
MAQELRSPDEHRESAQVLRFPPRGHPPEPTLPLPTGEANDADPSGDLAPYEQDIDDREPNYPQRMLMNAIAIVVVTVLVGAGVWIADTISDMQRKQDCVLQGRENCMPIEVPAPRR